MIDNPPHTGTGIVVCEWMRSIVHLGAAGFKETPSLTTQSSDIGTSLLSVPGRQGIDLKRLMISLSSHVCTNNLTMEETKSASDRRQIKYKHMSCSQPYRRKITVPSYGLVSNVLPKPSLSNSRQRMWKSRGNRVAPDHMLSSRCADKQHFDQRRLIHLRWRTQML